MKIEDVPQDQDPAFEGGTKICYAVNPLGQIVPVRSSGWQTEAVVKDIAWQVIERELATCRARVLSGQASALEYFMKARQMDVALLAQNMGYITWRVRWHLRPKVWAKINARILQRYATCLEVPAHRLQDVSGLEGENGTLD